VVPQTHLGKVETAFFVPGQLRQSDTSNTPRSPLIRLTTHSILFYYLVLLLAKLGVRRTAASTRGSHSFFSAPHGQDNPSTVHYDQRRRKYSPAYTPVHLTDVSSHARDLALTGRTEKREKGVPTPTAARDKWGQENRPP
jgi:hypothetical protein